MNRNKGRKALRYGNLLNAAKQKRNRLEGKEDTKATTVKAFYDTFLKKVGAKIDELCNCPCSNESLGIKGCVPSVQKCSVKSISAEQIETREITGKTSLIMRKTLEDTSTNSSLI
jgi:hypothetical protein